MGQDSTMTRRVLSVRSQHPEMSKYDRLGPQHLRMGSRDFSVTWTHDASEREETFEKAYSASYLPSREILQEIYDEVFSGNEIRSVVTVTVPTLSSASLQSKRPGAVWTLLATGTKNHPPSFVRVW